MLVRSNGADIGSGSGSGSASSCRYCCLLPQEAILQKMEKMEKSEEFTVVQKDHYSIRLVVAMYVVIVAIATAIWHC